MAYSNMQGIMAFSILDPAVRLNVSATIPQPCHDQETMQFEAISGGTLAKIDTLTKRQLQFSRLDWIRAVNGAGGLSRGRSSVSPCATDLCS